MRIALAAVLCFAALWVVALRPKPVTDVAVDPVPVAEPAKKKADPSSKADRKATARKAAEAPKAKKASAPVSGAAAVLADVEAGRTVVLLFWDGKSPEDHTVRRAVDRVDRRGGDVRVRVAPHRRISKYAAITAGVPVSSSPTVHVIGKGGKAEAIPGLTVSGEIDDAVSRVVRAGR